MTYNGIDMLGKSFSLPAVGGTRGEPWVIPMRPSRAHREQRSMQCRRGPLVYGQYFLQGFAILCKKSYMMRTAGCLTRAGRQNTLSLPGTRCGCQQQGCESRDDGVGSIGSRIGCCVRPLCQRGQKKLSSEVAERFEAPEGYPFPRGLPFRHHFS